MPTKNLVSLAGNSKGFPLYGSYVRVQYDGVLLESDLSLLESLYTQQRIKTRGMRCSLQLSELSA